MAQEDHAEFRARLCAAVRTHPEASLSDAREPRKKFVEKLNRDFLVQGMAPFYTLAEVRTRADTIVQKSGLTKNAEDLLTIAKAEEPDAVTDVSTLFNRTHALFMALEYLHICQYSRSAGPLDYLQQLEQFRQECPGLPFVMAADTAIRKKVFRLQAEQREKFNSYSDALKEVLTNHKYLWNDARTKAALSKPDHKKEAKAQPDAVELNDKPGSPSKKKRKRQIERLRDQLKQSAAKTTKVDRPGPPDKYKRIPSSEWQTITAASQLVKGPKRCRYFNSSMGCSMGDKCRFKHLRMKCGAAHVMVGNH